MQEHGSVSEQPRKIHYSASVHPVAKSWPPQPDEPFPGDLPRYVCCFCNTPTDGTPADETAFMLAYVGDRSEVISLGTHLSCLRRAVHPAVAESATLRTRE